MTPAIFSRRDWILIGLYAVFCACVLGAALYSSGSLSASRRAAIEFAEADSRANTEKRIAKCTAKPSAEIAECISNAVTDSRQMVLAEADLSAQQEMANWAFFLLVVTFLTLLVSGAGLFALMATIREARNANDITRTAIAFQNRAWLKITPRIVEDLHYDPQDHTISTGFEFKVENMGQDPARDVHVEARLVSAVDMDILHYQTALLEHVAQKPDRAIRPRRILFGGADVTFTHFFRDQEVLFSVADDLQSRIEDLSVAPIGIIGFVRYRLIGRSEFHHTCFAYELSSSFGRSGLLPVELKHLPYSFLLLHLKELSHGHGEIC